MESRGEPSRARNSAAVAVPEDQTSRRKILVLGSRKAGKSSCIKTVFQQVPVKDASFFGVTQRVEKIDYDSIVPLQLWDTPPNFEVADMDPRHLASFSTLVYVMDIQQDDSYRDATYRFVSIVLRAYLANPDMKFAVFVHKAEMQSEDYRSENYAEIQRAVHEDLEDFNYPSLRALSPDDDFNDRRFTDGIMSHLLGEIRFEVTSIHNVSLRDAWSKVLQGVMEMLPAVESLLLNFTETSGMDNSYLFDIGSAVVLATDNRHRNDATLEQVTEYLGRFLQFRDLYKDLKSAPAENGRPNGVNGLNGASEVESAHAEGGAEEDGGGDWWDKEDPSAQWMTQSTRLLPNTTITLWQFTPDIALIVLLRTDTWQAKRGGIEYNLTMLRKGIRDIMMAV